MGKTEFEKYGLKVESASGTSVGSEGEVWKRIRESREAAAYINSLVENLESRLASVVFQDAPSMANNSKEVARSQCDLAQAIDDNNQILDSIGRRLSYIQNNLQL